MEKTKRNSYFDIVRGLAMLAVTWGHCIQFFSIYGDFFANPAFQIVYGFHMPVYALISGYFLKFSSEKYPLGSLIWSKIKALLYPIFFYTGLYFCLTYLPVVVRREDFGGLAGIVRGWFPIFTGGSLWFLWSALECSILIGLLSRLSGGKPIVCFLLLHLGYGALYFLPNTELGLFMYPYFGAGFLFAGMKERSWVKQCWEREQTGWLALGLFAAGMLFFRSDDSVYVSGVSLWNGVYPWGEQLAVDLYRYFLGFTGSAAFLYLVKWMLIRGEDRGIFRYLARCGRNSMAIYIFQCFLISWFCRKAAEVIIPRLGFDLAVSCPGLYTWVFTPALACVFLFVLNFAAETIRKSKLLSRILLGS